MWKKHKKQERERNISMLIKRSHWLHKLSLPRKVQQALVQRTCKLIGKALSTARIKQKYNHNIQLVCTTKLALKTQSFPLGTLNPFSKVLSLHQIFIFWSVLSGDNGHMTKLDSSQGWLILGASSSINTSTEITSRLQSLWTCPFNSSHKLTGSCRKLCLKSQGIWALSWHFFPTILHFWILDSSL